MKSKILFTLCAAAFAAIAQTIKFDVKTDHENCVYKCGETAEFTVKVTGTNDVMVDSGILKVSIDNFGKKIVEERTVDLSKENPFTLKAKKDIPGFLRLQIRRGSEGIKVDPNLGNHPGCYTWGVAFDPEKIQPGAPNPEDFDQFWADAVKKLDETVPADVQLEEVPAKTNGKRTYYRISFATCADRRVWGWLSVPKAEGIFPVYVSVPGAGIGAHGTSGADGRAICITMNVHSYQQPETNEADRKAAYDEQDKKYAKPFGVPRYCQAGIHLGRESYFYYASLLGINRAVNWVWAHPKADKSRFTYSGTSQGGGFGFMLTGLNGHFTRSCIFVPAITDLLGFRQDNRQSGWPQLIEEQKPENKVAAEKWAPYFDGVNFARRIKCPVRVVAGFSDTTCTPVGVYAAYNVIPAEDKEILHGIGMGHRVYQYLYQQLDAWRNSPKSNK